MTQKDIPPRSEMEYFIQRNMEELGVYADVFHKRIATAFVGLQEEAENLQSEAYDQMASYGGGPDTDNSEIAELAYHAGVDFYLATDAIRQGIFNLMVAGLFHLFEQQSASLSKHMTAPGEFGKMDYGWGFLQEVLRSRSVDLSRFQNLSTIAELNLIANTVKHGEGRSSENLRVLRPDLFSDASPIIPGFRMPLRPLVGEGLTLTEKDFTLYHNCLKSFWTQLIGALLLVYCPTGLRD